MGRGEATAQILHGDPSLLTARPQARYRLRLLGYDANNHIHLLKDLRAYLGLGLHEARDIMRSPGLGRHLGGGLRLAELRPVEIALNRRGAELEVVADEWIPELVKLRLVGVDDSDGAKRKRIIDVIAAEFEVDRSAAEQLVWGALPRTLHAAIERTEAEALAETLSGLGAQVAVDPRQPR
jgi:ribosomal protein L7/L12